MIAPKAKQRGFLLNPFRFGGGGGDPYFSNVSLLLHGDGVDGSTVFTDNSAYDHVLTLVGNAIVSTAQSKFGGGSMYFDGTGDYAQTPSSTEFYFPDDFTVEGYVYALGGSQYIFGNWSAGVSNPLILSLEGSAGSQLPRFLANGGYLDIVRSGPGLAANTWHHVACSRVGSDVKLYANGVLYGSATYTSAIGPAEGYVMGVGTALGAAITSQSYLDDLRITKGIGRYPEAFTPPAAPFPDA